jgi:DNA-binding Xre family transcriptional regulator
MAREEKDITKGFLLQIGHNVKKARKDQKLSLEELGLEIGLTRMQVHRIQQGYNITAITLLKLSMALGVRPEELVKFDYKFRKEDLEKMVNTNKASKLKSKGKK